MKKLLCALLAVVMLLALCSCGSKKSDPTYNDAGYYDIFSLDDGGTTYSQADFAAAGTVIYLQLNDDGTGLIDWGDGSSDALTWHDGVINDGTGDFAYVLAGGMLTLDLSDGETSYVMIFKKGTAPSADAAPAADNTGSFAAPADQDGGAPAADSPAGAYRLIGMTVGAEEDSLNEETLAMMESLGLTVRLYLNADGTGVLDMYGEQMDLTWGDSAITMQGEAADYDYADGRLTVYIEGTEFMSFEKISDETDIQSSGAVFGETSPSRDDGRFDGYVTGDFTPVSGTFGDNGEFAVEILGAEPFVDSNSRDAVRFYYAFTNNSDEATSAWMELNTSAAEEGYELTSTYAWSEDDVDEYGNNSLRIQPGITLLCISEYTFKQDGADLLFTVSEYNGNELTASFDPAALPGRPDPIEIAPITDPSFYADYPASGSTDDYAVAFTGESEIADADSWADYDEVLRVFFDYTNNAGEAESCWMATNIYAYQDGVQLDVGYPKDSTDTDRNFDAEIQPGESLTCSECFELRSDSPVEVVFSTWDDVICAYTFTLG